MVPKNILLSESTVHNFKFCLLAQENALAFTMTARGVQGRLRNRADWLDV